MIGSQVRALVRPPPSSWVETFVSHLAFIAPEWGLFAAARVSAGGLCLAESLVCEFVSASKISVPRSSGDRFGDWVVAASAPPSGDFGPLSLRLKIAFRRLGSCARPIGGGCQRGRL
jgi:hypothetical protein